MRDRSTGRTRSAHKSRQLDLLNEPAPNHPNNSRQPDLFNTPAPNHPNNSRQPDLFNPECNEDVEKLSMETVSKLAPAIRHRPTDRISFEHAGADAGRVVTALSEETKASPEDLLIQ
jgi:hypothetical protein